MGLVCTRSSESYWAACAIVGAGLLLLVPLQGLALEETKGATPEKTASAEIILTWQEKKALSALWDRAVEPSRRALLNKWRMAQA